MVKVGRTDKNQYAVCELNGDVYRYVERNIEVVRANGINAEIRHW